MVAGVLYLFRRIYAEVGSALPLNGGSYTVLLNTTGKRLAAGAAVLTLLSYIATAVISANEAMHYAHNLYARARRHRAPRWACSASSPSSTSSASPSPRRSRWASSSCTWRR